MSLEGFEGCDTRARDSQIIDAWQQTWSLLDSTRGKQVDWNEAAALEYLGPPAYNQGKQSTIQDIYNNLYQILDRDNSPGDYKVHVRCDDWDHGCGATDQEGPSAYTVNESKNGGRIATINFCPRYFTFPHLYQAVDREHRNNNPREIYDLRSYDLTKEHIFIHEMLHINWVHKSGNYGSNEPVVDLWMDFKEAGSDQQKRVRVYGPYYAKILARYRDPHTLGGFIAKSDESLALYLLAKYIQGEFGAYPHRPVVNTDPNRTPQVPRHGEAFEVDGDDNVFWNTSYVEQDPRQDMANATEGVTITQFIQDSELSASYDDAWHNWALDGVGFTNVHIENFDGWMTVYTNNDQGQQDVQVKQGSSVGIFDGWFTYWTDSCPNATQTYIFEETYGDVYLKADGYLHDSGDNKIGNVQFPCHS